MIQPSLFDSDEPAPAPEPPQQRAEPWLIDELVKAGVPRETAEGYSMRQAYAVRSSLARAKQPGAKSKKGKKPADPDAPQVFTDGPAELPRGMPSHIERLETAKALAAVVRDYEAGTADKDEVYRTLRGALYVFSSSELVRISKGLIQVLTGETHEGKRVGATGEADAGRTAEILCGSHDGEPVECEGDGEPG